MDALDSLLQNLAPVTHNLPAPIQNLLISLLGPNCHKTLILDLHPAQPCLSLAISKVLGLGIIAASPLVKLDQIRILLASQSAQGISLLAYLLETASFGVGLAYNARRGNPISTYGENALIAAQNVVIAALVLKFKGQGAGAVVGFLAALGAAAWALANEQFVDEDLLGWLQIGAGILGVVSKAPQIYTVWSEGGTGQLSAFAVFMYLAGSLARIFTTMREVGDNRILAGFVAGFLLNAVLAVQMLYYWKSPAKEKARRLVKEKGEHVQENIALVSGSSADSTASANKPKTPSTRRRG